MTNRRASLLIRENKNQREITRKLAMDHDNLNDRFSLLQHLVLGGGGKSSLICDIEREKYYTNYRLEVRRLWIEKLALSYFPRGNMLYLPTTSLSWGVHKSLYSRALERFQISNSISFFKKQKVNMKDLLYKYLPTYICLCM